MLGDIFIINEDFFILKHYYGGYQKYAITRSKHDDGLETKIWGSVKRNIEYGIMLSYLPGVYATLKIIIVPFMY